MLSPVIEQHLDAGKINDPGTPVISCEPMIRTPRVVGSSPTAPTGSGSSSVLPVGAASPAGPEFAVEVERADPTREEQQA